MVALDGQPEARVQASRERIAFVLIDGLADIQIPDMANLTPLEAADTPTMDAVSGTNRRCKDLAKQLSDGNLACCSFWIERSA